MGSSAGLPVSLLVRLSMLQRLVPASERVPYASDEWAGMYDGCVM